jgi:hypothetical protein
VAKQTQILLVDDIDGGEATATVRFGFEGVSYEIDLSQQHADQFASAIGPYLKAARRAPHARRRTSGASQGRHDQSEVRAWAREKGLKISDRGRIPAEVLSEYDAAH